VRPEGLCCTSSSGIAGFHQPNEGGFRTLGVLAESWRIYLGFKAVQVQASVQRWQARRSDMTRRSSESHLERSGLRCTPVRWHARVSSSRCLPLTSCRAMPGLAVLCTVSALCLHRYQTYYYDPDRPPLNRALRGKAVHMEWGSNGAAPSAAARVHTARPPSMHSIAKYRQYAGSLWLGCLSASVTKKPEMITE
jgi:hypothetical protein